MSSDIQVLLDRALSEVRSSPDLAERVAAGGDQRRHRRRLAGGLSGIVALAGAAALLVLTITSTDNPPVDSVSATTPAPKRPTSPTVTPVTSVERFENGYSISPVSEKTGSLSPAVILAADEASWFLTSPSKVGSIRIVFGALSFSAVPSWSGKGLLPHNGLLVYLIIHSKAQITLHPGGYSGTGKTVTVVNASTGKAMFAWGAGNAASPDNSLPVGAVDMLPGKGRMPTPTAERASKPR